jgi:ABC-2 type transport system ATP-binding protein
LRGETGGAILRARVSTSITPAVETVDLAKSYPRVDALRGLSLRIEPGEIFALLGPNGAGKTTWISIVCGLVRPSAGTARVLGHDVVRDSLAARRCVGLVPQEVNFDPFFTPREVLRFQMGYYGVPPDDTRIDEVLAALDLSSKADTNTRALSGGMKRRLLIAKALVPSPRVVFLDEPTAGVDVALRHDLWSYVRTLRAGGTTIVLTTHYLEEAEALADRVAVIDKGTLVGMDTPAALLRRFGRKQVRFTLSAPWAGGGAETLPAPLRLLGATLDTTGHVVICPVAGTPATPIADLLALAATLSPAVIDVAIVQPTLEDVFLQLTGRSDVANLQQARA